MTRFRTLGALGAVALSATLLSGCSSLVEEVTTEIDISVACAEISGPLLAAGTSMNEAAADFEENPEAIGPTFREAADSLREAAEGLNNAEVQDATTATAGSLDDLADAFDAVIADPENADLEAVQAAGAAAEAELSEFQALCS